MRSSILKIGLLLILATAHSALVGCRSSSSSGPAAAPRSTDADVPASEPRSARVTASESATRSEPRAGERKGKFQATPTSPEFVNICDRGLIGELIAEDLSTYQKKYDCSRVPAQGIASLKRLIVNTDDLMPEIPLGAFSDLVSLEELQIFCTGYSCQYEKQFKNIPANAFKDLSSLKKLKLGSSGLTHIPANAFAGLNSLEVLDFSSSYNIENVSREAFRGLPSIQVIKFRSAYNYREVEENTFSRLTSLRELNFAGPFQSWAGLKKIPRDEFSSLKNLTTLDLSGNELEEWPSFDGLVSLKSLNLGGTGLTDVPDLRRLKNLEEIVLSNPTLNPPPPHIFSGLTKVKELSLSSNKFTTIPKALIHEMPLLNLESLGVEVVDPNVDYQALTNLACEEGVPCGADLAVIYQEERKNYEYAVKACKDHGGRLPSIKELARIIISEPFPNYGGLSPVNLGAPGASYNKIKYVQANGKADAFYFSNNGVQYSSRSNQLWSSSKSEDGDDCCRLTMQYTTKMGKAYLGNYYRNTIGDFVCVRK